MVPQPTKWAVIPFIMFIIVFSGAQCRAQGGGCSVTLYKLGPCWIPQRSPARAYSPPSVQSGSPPLQTCGLLTHWPNHRGPEEALHHAWG